MILILVAIVAALVASIVLLWYGNEGYQGRHTASGLVGVLLCIATGVSAIAYSFTAWSWIAADSKAQIINREYGTKYTREEVFYASDVIDTIREIDRKRVEVNGNVMRSSDE